MAEVDTAYAIENFSAHSGLIPEEVQPHQHASMVYDNIDHLEKTISGAGTTHRVIGMVLCQGIILQLITEPLALDNSDTW